MARKETAKQRRARKEAERKQRIAYERGEIPAGIPKSKAGRMKRETERRTAQREYSSFLNRPTEETNKMTWGTLADDVNALHNLAYAKYHALMQQGTPTAATAIYESEFAGMNAYDNSINANRAMAAKLRAWLKRKDTSLKRAKRQQEIAYHWAKKRGFKGTRDDLADMYEMMGKYRELYGSNFNYNVFPAAYSAVIDSGGDMQQVFKKAETEARKEYEKNVGFDTFGGNPLDVVGGVLPPEPSELLVSYQKPLSSRKPTPWKKQAPRNRSERRKI